MKHVLVYFYLCLICTVAVTSMESHIKDISVPYTQLGSQNRHANAMVTLADQGEERKSMEADGAEKWVYQSDYTGPGTHPINPSPCC
ncbi:uncharacterized protein LOC131044926 [Cryptomeria japonica]|uniref:uncharacterized protein LOC131044926 n=1 Tax=Cryptomeria japonica TaxID=3369 RepID=UPI0027DA6722|nr:uncharacterized protein LOC131044926 [Cryptomeria japonica]XP_059063492.1 uncharacterized protein LOC131044926 [Cryptomeria japonica]